MSNEELLHLCNELIAYCQQNDLLSRYSTLWKELSDISGIDEEILRDALE